MEHIEYRIEAKLKSEILKKKNGIWRKKNPVNINKFKFKDTLSDKENKQKDIEDKLKTSFKDYIKEEVNRDLTYIINMPNTQLDGVYVKYTGVTNPNGTVQVKTYGVQDNKIQRTYNVKPNVLVDVRVGLADRMMKQKEENKKENANNTWKASYKAIK